MTALWLFSTSVYRHLRQAVPAPTTSEAAGESEDDRELPSSATTMWDVAIYAIGSTSRTLRLCVLVVVALLAILLVTRLGIRFIIEFVK